MIRVQAILYFYALLRAESTRNYFAGLLHAQAGALSLKQRLFTQFLAVAGCLPVVPASSRALARGLRKLILRGDVASALSEFKRAADLGSVLVENTLYFLGVASFRAGNYENSRALFSLACERDPNFAQANYYLALMHLVLRNESAAQAPLLRAISRDNTYAMAHQNFAADYYKEHGVWTPTSFDLSGDIDIHLYDAYHYVGQLLIHAGEAGHGVEMYGKAMMVQARLASKYTVPDSLVEALHKFDGFDAAKPLRILPYEWVTKIGHLGLIDVVLKMQRLGMRPDVNWVLLAPGHKVVNQRFLDCLRPYLVIVEDQDLIDALFPYQRVCGEQFNCYMQADGSAIDWCDAASRAFVEWDRQERPSLLQATAAIMQQGEKLREEMGMPRDAWFVALHIRSGGSFQEGRRSMIEHRNSSLESYLPAIKKITEAGGWVIRMGDPGMPALAPMERVFDLAHSPSHVKEHDVYCWSQAKFFIGTTSGPSTVAVAFHTPALLVNCVSNYAQHWNNRVVFLLKRFWSEKLKRYLTMKEITDPGFRGRLFNIYALIRNGVYPEENSGEDIAGAVEEMLGDLEKGGLSPMQDPGPLRDMQSLLWLWGNAHPSKFFFTRHRQLLTE